MKKVNVIFGNSNEILFNKAIKNITPFLNDINRQNIVIVPDKLSLYTETKIFELLNIEVYFNLTVVGISKFVTNLFKENNLDYASCSNLESKLLVLKAIQNVKKELKCFKRINYGLVDEIYSKIEQIKSSNCKIQDLVDEKASLGTKLKFDDIAKIFNEYEILRCGKLDSADLLSFFNQTSKNLNLANSNVFFVGFDSLTKQGLQVFKNVCENANHTEIAVLKPNKNNLNARLYDETFYKQVEQTLKEENIEYEKEDIYDVYAQVEKNVALHNLFSFTQIKTNNNFFNIVNASSCQEEIELVVKQINYNIRKNNAKFNDFAICANENYHKNIKSFLEQVGIDCYVDSKHSLINLEPIKYIFNYLKFISKNDDEELCKIVLNEFCPLEQNSRETLLNEIRKYSKIKNMLKYSKCLTEDILLFLKQIDDYKKIIKNTNILELLKNIIDNSKIFEKINEKCIFFENNGQILLNKIFLQIENELNNVIDVLEKLFDFSKISLLEFVDIFERILTETEISSVPSSTNQVFVGNEKSFYYDKKHIFIMGQNEGESPITLSDLGLISDREIESETIKAKIEPTTKIINKRNKFKLFDILLSAQRTCTLLYHNFNNNGQPAVKNDFISELERIFNIKEISAYELKILTNSSKIEKLMFNAIDNYNANLLIGNKSNAVELIETSLLKSANKYLPTDKSKIVCDIKSLLLKNNKVSISIIESYNNCPRLAFLSRGLNLQKLQNDKMQTNVIGTFIHEIGERFVNANKNNLGNMNEIDICNFVSVSFDKMLTDEQYYALNLPENTILTKLIKKECERFCNFINKEQSLTDFKPEHTELRFGNGKFAPIKLEICGEEYFVSGIVDRLDVCDNHFRIIDYKTYDKTNKSGVSNLYYGIGIQLFVYAKAIKESINKNLFGVFYLPLKSTFSQEQEDYSFSGFNIDDKALVMRADKSFQDGSSPLLNIKTKKDGSFSSKSVLTEEQMDLFLQYSIELMEQTIKDLSSGFIDCSPFADMCEKCDFKNICKYNLSSNNILDERKKKYKITNNLIYEVHYD